MPYLVPYFKDVSSNPNWINLGIFLCEGGRSLWSLEESDTDADIKSMLKDNEFPVLNLRHLGNIIYAEIDMSAIKMSDFYQWTDLINPKTSESDVWRTLPIPKALWSCPVFKEHFWDSANLPIRIDSSLV